jgi:hypothetical protein
VVLDLGLPSLDGLAVLKRWRANGRTMPVLVLTARGTWQERVEGIEAGADDYLPKPFRMEELIARARALVRRAGGHAAALQEAGDLSLDTNRMGVALRGVSGAGHGAGIPASGLPDAASRPARARRANCWSTFTATTTRARRTRWRRSSPGCAGSWGRA